MVSKKKNRLFVWVVKKICLSRSGFHHSASVVMPIAEPQDRFLNLALTLMMDSYILFLKL